MVAQHETFLVHADRRPNDFRRNGEETLVERAHERHWPFDESRDFFEQASVLDKLQPLREGEILRVMQNDVAPARRIDDDFGALERERIILEALHANGLRRQEAMAVGQIARCDSVDLETDDLGRFRLRSEGRHDGMERPHPAQRIPALGRRAPAHRLRPGKALDDRRQNFSENVDRLRAGALDDGEIKLGALLVLRDLRLIERGESGALQEAGDRRLRRADARAFALFADIGLARRQADHLQRETARRRISGGALIGQAALHERIGDEPLQVVSRLPLHTRRNFFGEEFEKEIGHLRFYALRLIPSARCGRHAPGFIHPPLEGEGRTATQSGVG